MHFRMCLNPIQVNCKCVQVKWNVWNSPPNCWMHFPKGWNPVQGKWSAWNSLLSWRMHFRKGLNPFHVKWNACIAHSATTLSGLSALCGAIGRCTENNKRNRPKLDRTSRKFFLCGIINNYSMSPRWIWSDKITNERVARVGYNHFISNKGEWNNCFSKFSNRVLPPIFISTILHSENF